MENAKQIAIFSDSCKDIMLDTEEEIIKSIAKGLKIEGSGTVEYQFNADDGSVIVLQCEAFYLLDMHMRLLSPQDTGTSAGNPV
eukprot:9380270-Ditylum_brightwellii.AAC.1